jgi:transcriptional regulator with XRE-family HTH domain
VAATEPEPPQSWKYCGEQIKLWRTRAGVSREELGKEAGYAYETVSSMEVGRRRPSKRLLTVADQMCRAGGFLVAADKFLTPEKFPLRSMEFMHNEAEAVVLHSYEALLIPGLLQTEAYTRSLIHEYFPPLDDETIDERVRARLHRQEKLTATPPTLFSFVVYEPALRSHVADRDTLREQLHHLLRVRQLRNVSLQVLPADRGSTQALYGPVVLLENKHHEKFAYVEAQGSSFLHSDAGKVSALTETYGMIRMQALDVEESARFISELAEEL